MVPKLNDKLVENVLARKVDTSIGVFLTQKGAGLGIGAGRDMKDCRRLCREGDGCAFFDDGELENRALNSSALRRASADSG